MQLAAATIRRGHGSPRGGRGRDGPRGARRSPSPSRSSCSSTCRSSRSRASRARCSGRWRSPWPWRCSARCVFAHRVPGAGGLRAARPARRTTISTASGRSARDRRYRAPARRGSSPGRGRCSRRGAAAARWRGAAGRARSAPSSCRASTRASCRSTSSGCRRSSITEAQRARRAGREGAQPLPRGASPSSRAPGRAEVATDPVGNDETEVYGEAPAEGGVDHAPRSRRPRRRDQGSDRARGAGDVRLASRQPIEDRVNQLLAGSRADVVIKVFGDDLKTLKALADEIGRGRARRSRPGDLRVQRVLGLPLLEVRAGSRAPGSLRHVGRRRCSTVVEAARVGRHRRQDLRGPAPLRPPVLHAAATARPRRRSASSSSAAPERQLVPLSQLARPSRCAKGRPRSTARRCERRVLVEVNVRGRDLVGFVNDARRHVQQQVQLPAGYHARVGRASSRTSTAPRSACSFVVPMALGIIFGMLFLMFGDAALRGGGVRRRSVRAHRRHRSRSRCAGCPSRIPAAVGFIALWPASPCSTAWSWRAKCGRRLDRSATRDPVARRRRRRDATGAHHRARRGRRLLADGAVDARGRRGPAAAGDRGDRRHRLVDPAGARGAARTAAVIGRAIP